MMCDKQERSIAVMQPYFFPYLGYFQLIQAADEFVFYDDVDFIKQGWVNRNRILVNGKDHIFTVPLSKLSSNRAINETKINTAQFAKWRIKFIRTLRQNYARAPFSSDILPLVEDVLKEMPNSISDLAIKSVVRSYEYLGLPLNYSLSSIRFPESQDLDRVERLKEICRRTGSNVYINPIGGRDLYSKADFRSSQIVLKWLNPILPEYKQIGKGFISGLSIIDVLMFNDVTACREMFNSYELL